MKEQIDAIALKHSESGIDIHPAANMLDIGALEKRIGFSSPADFREFYLICNGLARR